MYILFKTGTACLRVADPHLIFDRICIHVIRTHMHSLLPEDPALALMQVLSLCNIPILPPIISGGDI